MFGTINADNKSALNAIDQTVSSAKKADNSFSNFLGSIGNAATNAGSKLTSMITKPAVGAATALTGVTLVKGFNRLLGIDEAKAKLLGLGHDADSVKNIMNSALESVKGTSYGLEEAATTAAGAVAAGIEPGEKLTKYLTLTADAAAIAGTSMSEMGSIVNKVTTSGRAMTENLEQLSDRGLPIYQWLGEAAGVAASEVKDMASQGKISSEMFMEAIEKNIGGAAKIMGENSFKAAVANIGASIGRIGANFLDAGSKGGGFFSIVKPLLTEFNANLETVENKAAELGVKFGESFQKIVDKVLELKSKFDELSPEVQNATLKSAALGTALAVGIGPALTIFGKVTTALQPVAQGFETISALANSFGGSLLQLPSKAQTGFGAAKQGVTDFLGTGKQGIVDFGGNIKSIFSGLGGTVQTFGGVFTSVFSGGWDYISSGFSLLGGRIGNFLGTPLMSMKDMFSLVTSGIGADITGLAAKLSDSAFGGVVKSLAGNLQSVAGGAVGLVSQAGSAVTGIAGQVVSSLGSVVGIAMKFLGPGAIIAVLIAGLGLVNSQFGDQIDQIIKSMIEKGPEMITGFVNGIREKLPDLIASGTEMVTSLAEAITVNLPVIIQSGLDLLRTLVSGLSQNIEPLMQAAIMVITSLATSLISAAPQLIMIGMNLLLELVNGLVANIPTLLESAEQIISSLTSSLSTFLPNLINTGIQIIVTLINGITQMMPTLLPLALELILTIFNALLANLPQIIQGGIQILTALIDGVTQILPQLIPMVVQIIVAIITAIAENLPQILEMGIKLLGELAKGIIEALPEITKAALEIFPVVWDAIKEVDWLQIGADIIAGIASGIKDAAGSLWKAAKKVLGGFKDNVLEFFGIHSPSRWGRDAVGRWIPQGIGGGITKDGDYIQNALTDVAKRLTFEPSLDTDFMNFDLNNLRMNNPQNVTDGTQNSNNITSSEDGNKPIQLIIKVGEEVLGTIFTTFNEWQGKEIDIQSQF